MLIKKSLMKLLKQARMSPLRLTTFASRNYENSHMDEDRETPVQKKHTFKPRTTIPFQSNTLDVLLRSEKKELIDELKSLKFEGELSEFIIGTIGSLETREGIEFWTKLSPEERTKMVKTLIDIKQDHFQGQDRNISRAILSALIKITHFAESYELLFDTSKLLFESLKSKALKISFIQNFFLNAERTKINKSNKVFQDNIKYLEVNLIDLLYSDEENSSDFKFVNLACRAVTDYMAFILSRFTTPSQKTSKIVSFMFRNRIDTLDFYPLAKGTSLILEMLIKKIYRLKIMDEYNLEFINEMLFYRKQMASEFGTTKDIEQVEFMMNIELERNLSTDTYNYFLQGMFMKNEQNWTNKIIPLAFYANSSKLLYPKRDFGKWVLALLATENVERLTKNQLNQLIQVLANLTTLQQGKELKVQVIQAYKPFMKFVNNKNDLVNHLKLAASFLPRVGGHEDYDKDNSFQLSDEEEEIVQDYTKQLLTLTETDIKSQNDPNSILELIQLLVLRFKILTPVELRDSWLHESFIKILSRKTNLSTYMLKIITAFDCYDLTNNTEMLKTFRDVLNMVEENLLKFSLAYSSYEKKRLRTFLTKFEEQITETDNSENMELLNEVKATMTRIEEIKFVRKE